MDITCLGCGQDGVEIFSSCPSCGRIADLEDIVRPIGTLLEQLRICTVCRAKSHDGWKCHRCGVSIAEKAKKAYACVLLSGRESKMVTEYFQKSV